MMIEDFWFRSSIVNPKLELIFGILLCFWGIREIKRYRDEVKEEKRERLGSWIAEIMDWLTLFPRFSEQNSSFAAGFISFSIGILILVRLGVRFLF